MLLQDKLLYKIKDQGLVINQKLEKPVLPHSVSEKFGEENQHEDYTWVHNFVFYTH